MSTPRSTKRTHSPANTEQNKRRRLSPEAGKTIIDDPQNTPSQPTLSADESLDDRADLLLAEQEEAERIELEERQAVRRLQAIRARKEARQSRKPGSSGASLGLNPPVTPTPGHRVPVTPAQSPRHSGRQVGSSFQPIDLDPAPGRTQETVSIKQELYHDILPARRVSPPNAPTASRRTAAPSSSRPIFRRPPSLSQGGATPVTAPVPASTRAASRILAAASKPTLAKPPSQPKAPTTGKRAFEDFTADTLNDYDYYAYGHGSQRQKLSDGRSSPVLPPFPSTPNSPEPQRGVRLPSSDGIDLKALHPKRTAADRPQKGAASRATSSGSTGSRSVHGSQTPATTTATNARVLQKNNIRASPRGSSLAPATSTTCQEPANTYERNPALARFFESAALEFQTLFPAEVPSQPNLPVSFTPFATTEHLGKHRRDGDVPTVDEETQDEVQGAADGPTTKRQKRVKKLEAKGEMLGKDNRKMNKDVRQTADGLEVMIQGVWTSAAYHNDRRNSLLQRADRDGTWDTEHGVDPDDRMAFHPKWKDVNMKDRTKRPDILYQWKPNPKPEKYHPGYLYDKADGKVLIDHSGFPIKAWPDLPICVSGQTSPIWFELWRRINQNISVRDIWARCPKQTQRKPGQKVQELTLQAFSNRMRRARVHLGTVAWDPRDGSENIGAQLLKLMPNHVRADLDALGSTGGWRDFTSAEVDAISSINHGIESAQGRAGTKALPEAVKKDRDEKRRLKFHATLNALLEEKKEIDRKHQASLDKEAAEEAADTAFEGPVHGSDNRLPESDAEPSYPDADLAPYAHDPLSAYGNILSSAESGNASFKVNNFNGGSDDTILLDPALEEGDTTLVEDVNSHQPTDLKALEEKAEIDLGPSGFGEPNWDEVDYSFLVEGQDDYRLKFPETEDQIASVLAALEKTRDECRRLTGMEPPETKVSTSYFMYYHELQGWLSNIYFWTRSGEDVPKLFERPAWTGSWDSWIMQDDDPSSGFRTQYGASSPGKGIGNNLPTDVNLNNPAKGSPEPGKQYPDLGANKTEGQNIEQGQTEGDGLDDLFNDQDLALDVNDPGATEDSVGSSIQAAMFGRYDPTFMDGLGDELDDYLRGI